MILDTKTITPYLRLVPVAIKYAYLAFVLYLGWSFVANTEAWEGAVYAEVHAIQMSQTADDSAISPTEPETTRL
jgi:hypothetical protein